MTNWRASCEKLKIPGNSLKSVLQCMAESENIDVPGGVYLCQVSDSVSCGACCGLYNLENVSRESLYKILEERTFEFAGICREVSEIISFGETVCRRAHKNQPFPEFHHCPFVGLIGSELSRVGCLLHPMADGNKGIDFRGLSYYGGMACRIYFCPVNRCLPERIKIIVRACFDDWYTYGLIITEKDLISEIFREIEMLLGNQVNPDTISPQALSPIKRLLTLKLKWPFRSPEWPVGNYFFEDRQYCPPVIDYPKIQANPSRYHGVLQALGSKFFSAESLYQAESILEDHFEDVMAKLSPAC